MYHLFASSAGNSTSSHLHPRVKNWRVSVSLYSHAREPYDHPRCSFPTCVQDSSDQCQMATQCGKRIFIDSTPWTRTSNAIFLLLCLVRWEIWWYLGRLLWWCRSIFEASFGCKTNCHRKEDRIRSSNGPSPQTTYQSSDLLSSRSEKSMDSYGSESEQAVLSTALMFCSSRAPMEPCSSSTLHRKVWIPLVLSMWKRKSNSWHGHPLNT